MLPRMALPVSFLTPGRNVRVRCAGEDLAGTVTSCANGWLRLATTQGDTLVNLALVAWVAGGGGGAPADDGDGAGDEDRGLPRPSAAEITAKPASSKAPGRPWSDSQVQAVVDDFLNDRQDGEIAANHGRTRNQVTVLRQAWECARGNLPDDGISPAARLWVERIRRAMRPE